MGAAGDRLSPYDRQVFDGDGGLSVGLYAAAVAVAVLAGLGVLAVVFDQPFLVPSGESAA